MDRRSNCPLSCWLDLFGDRWTLLILRDLLVFGKENYKDMLNAEEGISTNILADRLQKLVAQGLVTKEQDKSNGLKYIYRPTPNAQALMPVFLEIVNWSNTFVPDTYGFKDLEARKEVKKRG